MLKAEMPYFIVACSALGHKGDIDSLNLLAKLLLNKDWCKRRAAVSSLIYMKNDEDFHIITKLFLKDKSKLVKNESAWYIRTRSNKDNWRSYINLLMGSELPRHRMSACELVGIYGEGIDLGILEKLKKDKDGHVRWLATKIISENVV